MSSFTKFLNKIHNFIYPKKQISLIQITGDKSPTLFSEKFQQTYHSIHGAINESNHIFIDYGLKEIAKQKTDISVFEMGFGTGLNAVLTWDEIESSCQELNVNYESIELYPIEENVWRKLKFESENLQNKLFKVHESEWNKTIEFKNFQFSKYKIDLLNFESNSKYDLVYFDAFSPDVQPELWTDDIFQKIYYSMNHNARLTTYSAKGELKRVLKRCGFDLEHPPGPMGKREMTVAIKN